MNLDELLNLNDKQFKEIETDFKKSNLKHFEEYVKQYKLKQLLLDEVVN